MVLHENKIIFQTVLAISWDISVFAFYPGIFLTSLKLRAQLEKGDVRYFLASIKIQQCSKSDDSCMVVCLCCQVTVNQMRLNHPHRILTKQIN